MAEIAGGAGRLLRLDGGGQTLLVVVGADAPKLAYWGSALAPEAEGALDLRMFERAVPHGMLDAGEALSLSPEAGQGFTGRAALEWRRPDGAFVSQSAPTNVHSLPQGWQLVLQDLHAGLETRVSVTLDSETGVAAFRTEVTNRGHTPLGLDHVSACALPAPGDELLVFDGRWGREFRVTRTKLGGGCYVQENRTGRTSHHAPPLLVAGESGFSEHHGTVIGFHLGWSGDHRLSAERLRDGRVQVQAGELFWPGEVVLAPGETYETPWLYVAKSTEGLNGMSDRFHRFVRDTILGGRLRDKPRPVHFNTWEAVYFRHEREELFALAQTAADVGAERFVLDDGWFRGRVDDRRALGDWTPDLVKYPQGLGPLIDHVRGLGMEFGLWVEPEMVNADSDLIRTYPDWVLGVPGRDQPLGRGQYLLDITRAEVADNIFRQLDTLLREHPIGYLKWDFNRDLTHPQSGGRPASRARTLAAYALIDRLRAAHPGVEIESCAAGGGRADYEILKRTDRIWTSDCNDPLERQSIQRGFSFFFPPQVMGAHVGPRESHTTARTTSLDLRVMTALFGHMGIEADIRRFRPEDQAELAAGLALYKRFRGLLHGGRTWRLTPPDPGAAAFMVVGADGALASYAQMETPLYAALEPLKLIGLGPDQTFAIRLLNPPARPGATMKVIPDLARGETLRATGRLLSEVGLPLPVLRAGQVAVFHLEPVTA